jgi:hypothetical protein
MCVNQPTGTGRVLRALVLACAALAATAGGAQAQVRVDPATMVVSSDRTDRTTWNHQVPAGADRYLLVALTMGGVPAPVPAVTSLTCGGVALERLGWISHPSGLRVELWGLLEPPAGPQPIELRLASEAAVVAGSVAFLGVDPDSPTGPVATGEGNGPVASVTVVSVQGAQIVDVYGSLTAMPSAGSGQMINWNQRNTIAGASSSRSGSNTVVMSWSHGAVTHSWAQAAVSVRARSSPVWPEPGPAPELPPDAPPVEAGGVDAGSLPPLPDASPESAVAVDAGGEVGAPDRPGVQPVDGSASPDGGASPDGAAMLRRARLDLGCACDLGGDRDRAVGGLAWLLAAALAAFLGRRRR